MPASDAAAGAVRSPHRLSFSDRVMLATRIGAATLLTALYVTSGLRFGATTRPYFLGGLALTDLAALVALVAMTVLRQRRRMVMRELVIFDVASIALLAFAVAPAQDLVYAWALGLCVIFGDTMPAFEALAFATFIGAAYFVGQFAGPAFTSSTGAVVVLAVKSSFTLLFAWTRSAALVLQDERERRLRKTQREYHDLNKDLSRRIGELRATSDISEIIHSTLDFDEVGQFVLEILCKVIDLPASALFVIDHAQNETLFEASFGVRPPVPEDPSELLIVRGPRGLLGDVRVLDGRRAQRLHRRLLRVERPVGGAERRGSARPHLRRQRAAGGSRELAALQADEATVDHRRAHRAVQLPFHAGTRCRTRSSAPGGSGASLSLLMIDVDNFKIFNDTHGHIAGDARARASSRPRSGASVRDIDVVCRYGGEEFTIMLPETDADGAFVAAEKVREAVAAHRFPDADGNANVSDDGLDRARHLPGARRRP